MVEIQIGPQRASRAQPNALRVRSNAHNGRRPSVWEAH